MAPDQLPDEHDPMVIVAATLDEWWITSDPLAAFHAPALAHQIENHLNYYGYSITRTRPVPGRAAIAVGLAFALVLAVLAALLAHRSQWAWVIVAAVLGTLITHESVRDLADRRDARNENGR
ncbi:hypothetical protein ACIBAC_29040 [Streptomyces sp. NPDC051362]|uniref:hypothetical protein n=1 Tax=Streptomyces sp. NPDC051362 TaxID=3365651 RepID=UPI00378C1798